MDDIRIRLKTSRKIKRIISLTDGKKLRRTGKSPGEMRVVLPELKVFEIVLVEYAL